MNRNLQNLYTINFRIALTFYGVLLAYFVLYSLSIIRADAQITLLAIPVILVVFLPVNLFIKSKNKNYSLKLPECLPKRFLKILPSVTFIIFVLVFISGIIFYPGAPIQPNGSLFIDKVGTEYTYEQFRSFQKWEVAFIVSWSIIILFSIVYLPFLDATNRKCRF
jgi:hypothetical protein